MNTRGAVVVGIDHYSFATNLGGCVSDARKISELLDRNEDGSKNFKVNLITSEEGSKKITRPFLRKQISNLFSAQGEIALLYFSGHGTENDLGGYLVTQDAQQYDEGVSLRDVLELANNSKSTETVIILDSCYSGFLGNDLRKDNTAEIREGLSILTACRKDQKAYESAGTGVFSSLLIEGLEGGAADILGKVTIAGLFNYADQALDFFEQRPLFKSHLDRLSSIRRCNPQIELNILRKLPEYFETASTGHPLNPTYEPTSAPPFPAPIPGNVAIFRDLQKCRAAGLVFPLSCDHMYDEAMASGSCQLSAQGKYYWYLAKAGII